MRNYSTIPGSNSVIYLGHTPKQPLIGAGSELVDGYEPHGQKGHPADTAVRQYQSGGREEVYPGWVGWVGSREGLYRVLPSRPDLRLI